MEDRTDKEDQQDDCGRLGDGVRRGRTVGSLWKTWGWSVEEDRTRPMGRQWKIWRWCLEDRTEQGNQWETGETPGEDVLKRIGQGDQWED